MKAKKIGKIKITVYKNNDGYSLFYIKANDENYFQLLIF